MGTIPWAGHALSIREGHDREDTETESGAAERGRDVSVDQDQNVSLSHFLNSYDPSLAAL